MQMARKKLDRETNIVEIIQSWRYMESALELLLPSAQRLSLIAKSKQTTIDPDEKSAVEGEQSETTHTTVRPLKKLDFSEMNPLKD